jgi:hypothetical protein
MIQTKNPLQNAVDFIKVKLPDLDSNQDKQNQNLRYYRYTIGQNKPSQLKLRTEAQYT